MKIPPRAAAVRASATASASPSTPSAKSASSAQAASSSFQAGQATTSVGAVFATAQEAVGGLDASPAKDLLSKLLNKGIPSRDEIEDGIAAFTELGESMSPEDRKSIEKALCLQMGGRTFSDQIKESMDKMMAELAEKKS